MGHALQYSMLAMLLYMGLAFMTVSLESLALFGTARPMLATAKALMEMPSIYLGRLIYGLTTVSLRAAPMA